MLAFWAQLFYIKNMLAFWAQLFKYKKTLAFASLGFTLVIGV